MYKSREKLKKYYGALTPNKLLATKSRSFKSGSRKSTKSRDNIEKPQIMINMSNSDVFKNKSFSLKKNKMYKLGNKRLNKTGGFYEKSNSNDKKCDFRTHKMIKSAALAKKSNGFQFFVKNFEKNPVFLESAYNNGKKLFFKVSDFFV